jgi:aspartate/methionine/tyrosine aminotransferase
MAPFKRAPIHVKNLPKDKSGLQQAQDQLMQEYQSLQGESLALDLTRGKPSSEQLSRSYDLDGILARYYIEGDTDLRNYGGLYGIESARKLGAEILDVPADEVLAGGNSSLTLMYQAASFALLFGPGTSETPWSKGKVKFLCPCPGYDRHFSICEELGIEMVTVAINNDGPDMDAVEALVKSDPDIKGMWCVPKYSNPTGCVYSEKTVDRIAALGKVAGPGFRVFWDNAYAVHDFDEALELASIHEACAKHGTQDSVYQFASTSKITFAGSGISWMAASADNLQGFTRHLGMATIGPDKINQARHLRFLPDKNAVMAHMQKHAAIIKPRFDAVLEKLEDNLGEDFGNWSKPLGGYFISFNTRPGLANRVIQLADDAGVKLTPAGSTYPKKHDPYNSNIRLAPTVPSLQEVIKAMDVFVVAVKLATVEQALENA